MYSRKLSYILRERTDLNITRAQKYTLFKLTIDTKEYTKVLDRVLVLNLIDIR